MPVVVAVFGAYVYGVLQERASTKKMRALARAEIRTNLIVLHRKLAMIRETAASAGGADANVQFATLASRIQGTNLHATFCEAFENVATDVSNEFAEAADAYCTPVRGFSTIERGLWEIWERGLDAQGFSESLSVLEAQLALACLLAEPERQYIFHFTALYAIAGQMGLSSAEILEPLPGMADIEGVTRHVLPEPNIESLLKDTFGIECP